ncbi:MAG: Fpg/Nei family DNA glycosylase [Gemmatimonadales bacterium]
MPELPDITVYIEALERRVLGHPLLKALIINPFVLRSYDPPIAEAEGLSVRAVRRLGKRLVFELDASPQPLFLVIHLMIAGRLHWHDAPPRINRRRTLAALTFTSGTLTLTEAGTKRRASIHLVRGAQALAAHDRGGLEVLEASLHAFGERLRSENHTLKRALTDPRLFSGIGNAYSDEILHRARMSPLTLTTRLTDEGVRTLFEAIRAVLSEWTERLRLLAGGEFPEKVTAFREGMAVHGRFRQACPSCGASVQRIRYADNETNYCARCQTGGKLLADRSLSRLLKDDWPKSIDEL